MKCEDCLPLIEEYVDGELDGRTIERLTKHLTICASCERELAELRREGEIYARYQREVEVTPAQWNIIRARIEQERDAQEDVAANTAQTRRPAWLAGAASSRPRLFRPAFITAFAVLVIAIFAGIIFLNSRSNQTELATRTAPPPQRVETSAEEKRTGTPQSGNSATESRDRNVQKREGGDQQVARTTIDGAPNVERRNRVATAATSPRRFLNRQPKQTAPDNSVPFVEAAARISDNSLADVRQDVPEFSPDFDFEVARHAARAEMLLRSFRNARPARRTRTLDVAYEKQQSRKLLYRNIALRRDAASRGDGPASALLNTLEPILLDIANLPDRVKASDVRSIERRMEKKEIVAALQVQTLIASN